MPPVEGYIDHCDCTHVAGWCWRSDRPEEALELVVSYEGRELGRTAADKFRRDLVLSGKGSGRYGFQFDLPAEFLSSREDGRLSVRVLDTGYELVGSPAPVSRTIQEMIITPPVFAGFAEGPALDFVALRVDISNTCNLACVYCPTVAIRTKDRIELEAFKRFLADRVDGVDQFAIGCGQEPTTNPLLCDFLEAVACSRARPRELFMLVTNGTLLHKHDWNRMAASGLNALFLSLDSVDADVLADVRCGSKLALIQDNVDGLLAAAGGLRLHVNIVVTRRNIDGIDDVVEWSSSRSAETITLREMYFPPTTKVADEELFSLMLGEGEFGALRERLTDRWGGDRFRYADRLHLEEEYAYWAPKLV